MTTENQPTELAQRAVWNAENIELPRLATPDQRMMSAGIKAVTYALLDLAQAIREHGR